MHTYIYIYKYIKWFVALVQSVFSFVSYERRDAGSRDSVRYFFADRDVLCLPFCGLAPDLHKNVLTNRN